MVKINELYHNLDYYVWMMQPRFYTESLMNFYDAVHQYKKANKGKDPFEE